MGLNAEMSLLRRWARASQSEPGATTTPMRYQASHLAASAFARAYRHTVNRPGVPGGGVFQAKEIPPT